MSKTCVSPISTEQTGTTPGVPRSPIFPPPSRCLLIFPQNPAAQPTFPCNSSFPLSHRPAPTKSRPPIEMRTFRHTTLSSPSEYQANGNASRPASLRGAHAPPRVVFGAPAEQIQQLTRPDAAITY